MVLNHQEGNPEKKARISEKNSKNCIFITLQSIAYKHRIHVLCRIKSGVDVYVAGDASEYGNGNGFLMRVLPVVFHHYQDIENLVRLAMLQSVSTYPHSRSAICCALYAALLLIGEYQSPSTFESIVRPLLMDN